MDQTPAPAGSQRLSTPVDAVADAFLEETAALDPVSATAMGVPGHDTELTDYSPEGHAARTALRRRTLTSLDDVEAVDAVDRVTIAALRERLGLEDELAGIGADDRDLNVIASPLQSLRAVYDLMPTRTAEDWSTTATRLAGTPEAMHRYVQSLRRGLSDGRTPSRRQVERCADQAAEHGSPSGFFAALASGARTEDGDLPGPVADRLTKSAADAGQAYLDLATFLRTELLPAARDDDAVGREEYALRSRAFLGATVDLNETYAWGLDEVERIEAEMREVAEAIRPGAGIDEAMQALDDDPARRLEGTAALQAWMQTLSDAAVESLSGRHFDIPEPVRRLECRIAPTHEGGMYYTGPSEDFSRPGRMWWSVPEDVTWFSTWRETTTVYHEGVPGHHLQVAQTVYRKELLNRWRRVGCWVSGHGEGWALYAERLMADLGFLDDPGDRMGMLDGQRMRAARVVVDIGVHCGIEAPAAAGGGTWDADKALAWFRGKANLPESLVRFEVDRYLGWPGQAPSYKIGERLWLSLRNQVRDQQGADFDLAAFHRRALDVGSVGLDVLRGALLSDS